MSYYIDIIDTLSPLVKLKYEVASGGGIELVWNGADAKDALSIVSSEFNFDMLDPKHHDGLFKDYYTGNETRFKVQLKLSSDDTILWQGFLLPDLYTEPYTNSNLFVSFTATDGLGRLKGKYLPDEYYSREKSVIEIYTTILRLTGLELDLWFAPAIENNAVKDYNLIYVDTATFLDKDKKLDAYAILETFVESMLCVCYQADNRWYIEGMNMRMNRKMTYKKYDSAANLLGSVVYDRLVKTVIPLQSPSVTIIPPYNMITVSHKKEKPGLVDAVTTEPNKGWALVAGLTGKMNASEWMANGGYFGKCVAPGYNVAVYNEVYFNSIASDYPQDDSKFISLKQKLYFNVFDKIKIKLDFDVINHPTNAGDPASWNNKMKYEIVFNNAVIYSNFGGTVEDRESLIFSTGGSCKLEIDHIFQQEGLLDIRLYRPVGKAIDNGVLGVSLSDASVEIIDFQEVATITDLINDDFTVDKEVELEYAEDRTGVSKAFRLQKLKEDTSFYTEQAVFILYGLVYQGKNYAVVSLEDAHLIDCNPYGVYYNNVNITVLDVVYNLNGGEQMVIETIDYISSGYFYVKKYGYADVTTSRDSWVKWTDAFYKIETDSYLKSVANIYRRMFNVAHEKVDLDAKNAIKFNDIIKFKYEFVKDFVILNCTWNLDNNETKLVLGRSNYVNNTGVNPSGQNIPPIVNAADDYYILAGEHTVTLTATSYDPDGQVVSYLWTQVSGDTVATIINPTNLNAAITGLTGDNYVFQIQVTDDQGATATDTVAVIRKVDRVISLVEVESVDVNEPSTSRSGNGLRMIKKKYQVVVTPELGLGSSINISGKAYIYGRGEVDTTGNPVSINCTGWYMVEKNGFLLDGQAKSTDSVLYVNPKFLSEDVFFNYRAGDVIYVTITAIKKPNLMGIFGYVKAKSNIKLQTFTANALVGDVTGLPIEREVKIVTLYQQNGRGNFIERPD